MKKIRNNLVNTEGIIKISLSSMLLILSIIITILSKNFLIFLGMLASSVGDLYIMASRGVFGSKKYNTFGNGIVAFSLAHVYYSTVMLKDESKVLAIIICIMSLAIILCVALSKMKFASSLSMLFYAICLVLDFIIALNFNFLAAIGFASFMMSDAILGLKEKKEPMWQVPIWIFYVIAQICILISFNI